MSENEQSTNTVIFIIVGALAFSVLCGVAMFVYKQFQTRFTNGDYEFCTDEQYKHIHLEPNYLLKLHYLLHLSDKILKEANVEYVAISGTLLSIERTGFLTPWDDDGDLNVKKQDFVTHKKTLDKLLQKHHVYLKDPFWIANLEIFQLCFQYNHPILQKFPSESEPFVDWVLYEKMDEQTYRNDLVPADNEEPVYHFSSPRERELFPREFVYESELYPIKRAKLRVFNQSMAERLGLENPIVSLNVPHDSVALLNRTYGSKDDESSWKNCYLASSHRSVGLFVKPCKLTADQVKQLNV